MDNLILNQITFIGEEKLLNKVIKLLVSAKNSASTPALSKPDIGPQSRPSERAAIIR